MDGVKVTYIETRFVTSDAAGFKDLVQRLTGRSPTVAGAAPAPAASHKPRACRAAGAATAGPQGYYCQKSSTPPAAQVGDGRLAAPPCLGEAYGIEDFAGLLYGGASQNAQCVPGGYYSDYFTC